jgi:PAS domain S-box-containing protein
MVVDDKLHRRIVEATQEAVILADRDGRIELWNGGAERVFGWSSAEAGDRRRAALPAPLTLRF